MSLIENLFKRFLYFLPFVSDLFNYDNPTEWYVDFPQCVGFRQSPVAISSLKTFPIELPPIIFSSYSVPLSELSTLRNNGHSVEFVITESVNNEKPFISGGLLNDIYEADSVHFHWGSSQQRGSEHILNGRRYDLEMHIVHKNTKYSSLQKALNYDDGLAVLAVFFKVSKSDKLDSSGLYSIFRGLKFLTNVNATVEMETPMVLNTLLGNINRDTFFTYRGSLTTPPCSEAVTWFVFSDAVPVPYAMLQRFWSLLDDRGEPMLNNFRPIQPLKFRKIYRRQPNSDYDLDY